MGNERERVRIRGTQPSTRILAVINDRDDDENRREGLATLLRPLERQGERRERERGKERTVIV